MRHLHCARINLHVFGCQKREDVVGRLASLILRIEVQRVQMPAKKASMPSSPYAMTFTEAA